MIISKTKYNATDAEIKELFSFHKIGNVIDIAASGCGEFNAAYKVICDNGNSFALKIAPPESAKVLSYENNMMKSEVFWYSQMHEKTDILCPKVYVSDFSKQIIKSNCFIMGDKEEFAKTVLGYEGLWERLTLFFMYVPFVYKSAQSVIQ